MNAPLGIAETLAAFALLGLASTPHCAAMCGPLAARACGGRLLSASSGGYVVGRTSSYLALGALAGGLGSSVLEFVGPALRLVVAEFVALILLLEGVRMLRGGGLAATGVPVPTWVLPVWRRLPERGLGIGLATGFLPCGALLSALLLAAASGGSLQAAAGMAVFSLASLPGVLVLPLIAGATARLRFGTRAPDLARRVGGCTLIAIALWVAVRPALVSQHDHHHQRVGTQRS